MFVPKGIAELKKEIGWNGGVVAVAIDKDRGSQYALKWAIDHLLQRGQTVHLLHVKLRSSTSPSPRLSQIAADAQEDTNNGARQIDSQTKELFLPFRCFCTRKDIQCKDVIIEDVEVVKGLVEYVNLASVEHLVLGASAKGGFLRRFKEKDIPGNASKAAPDFVTVYVISKGKLASTRPAIRSAPSMSSVAKLCHQLLLIVEENDQQGRHQWSRGVVSLTQPNR